MKKRFVLFALAVSLVMTGIVGRLGYITFSGVYEVNQGYNSYLLTLDNLDPYLYDVNGNVLTNNETAYALVLRPNEKTAAQLYQLFSIDERRAIMEELQKGRPILRYMPNNRQTSYLKPYKVSQSGTAFSQLLSRRSAGLLSVLPDSVGAVKISFSLDARGRLLKGDEGKIINEQYGTQAGLQLTLDSRVQSIASEAARGMRSGCIVVMDIQTASLLASVVKPRDSYLNKSIRLYPAGSVFKIIVAACALEHHQTFRYTCNGSITVGDTVYSCQKNKAHGEQGLREALANSCNCAFVSLALQLGADKLLETAERFGFHDTTVLFSEFQFKNGLLPEASLLSSKGQLALFGFGQGSLMISPMHLCNALCTVAAHGMRRETCLVTDEVSPNGKRIPLKKEAGKAAVSAETADTLLQYLRYVVSDGTGMAADYQSQVAGKTATAQTGRYEAGAEILDTWFAGIYPYNEPRYAIVVMAEGGKSGAEDCCPIFRTIVEKLENL